MTEEGGKHKNIRWSSQGQGDLAFSFLCGVYGSGLDNTLFFFLCLAGWQAQLNNRPHGPRHY